jgi:hypothetical protein
VLDDHSRYNVCLQTCGDEQGKTVQQRLQLTFRCRRRSLSTMVLRGEIRVGSAGRGFPCGCLNWASAFCTAGRITRRAVVKMSAFTAP